MDKIIREVQGSRQVGVIYKDEDGYTYWKKREYLCPGKVYKCHVGSFLSHKRTMQRYRRRNQPNNPTTMKEFHEQLIGEYSHMVTVDDEPLYSGLVGNTEEEGDTLLFVLPRGFPVAFALMSRKTTKAYAALFEKLLSIEPQWQPETVIIDFELAAMAGIQFIFPSINIQGCWFHSSQAIWRKIGNLGMTELCTSDRGAYDTVHMIMALPLIPGNVLNEGFTSIQIYYRENIKPSLSAESQEKFENFFQYYKMTWLTGVFTNMLSVSGTVWRTNNVLEVSHQHLKMHIGSHHQPEPWKLSNRSSSYSSCNTARSPHLTTPPICPMPMINLYHCLKLFPNFPRTGVRNDYLIAVDGGFIGEPQRRIWIENQRRLDLAMRLFNEGRYTVLEFLICTRHVTPTFGVIRPQGAHNLTPNTEPPPFASTSHTELQPQQLVNLTPHQTNHLPSTASTSLQNPAIHVVTLTPVELQPRSLNSTNQQVQHVIDQQNNNLALQARARELLIERRRVNGSEITILDLIHGIDDDEVVTPPECFNVTRQDLNFLPLIEPKCYICLYSPSTVIAHPCNHQGLCQSCFESYIKMPPYQHIPYYRCALCRAEVEFYMIIRAAVTAVLP
ncbi:hypothetical protein ACI65C_006364 [Semiaphis heraclei]